MRVRAALAPFRSRTVRWRRSAHTNRLVSGLYEGLYCSWYAELNIRFATRREWEMWGGKEKIYIYVFLIQNLPRQCQRSGCRDPTPLACILSPRCPSESRRR